MKRSTLAILMTICVILIGMAIKKVKVIRFFPYYTRIHHEVTVSSKTPFYYSLWSEVQIKRFGMFEERRCTESKKYLWNKQLVEEWKIRHEEGMQKCWADVNKSLVELNDNILAIRL